MKAKKLSAVIIATLITITLFVSALSPTASALLDRKGSITLHVTNSSTGEPLEGVTFRLYFIANAYQSGNSVRYELIKPYDEANISIDNLQDSHLPIHLAAFAVFRSLPCTEKAADENGGIIFNDLTPGVYLLVPYGNFEGYYMPSPFIVNIPKYDSGKQIWEFDINATPKMLIIDGETETITTYISVQKIWDTDEKHPDSITVVLMRDMEIYDTVQLSKSNNWSYRWDGLTKNHVWNVVEKEVPDGYRVQYESSSNTVTIINKFTGTAETTTTHGELPTGTPPQGTTAPDSTSATGSTTTTLPGGNTPPDYTTLPGGEGTTGGSVTENTTSLTNIHETTTEQDKLAQTGQLNWPVPVLAISGLLIFSVGWAMLNFGKKETE